MGPIDVAEQPDTIEAPSLMLLSSEEVRTQLAEIKEGYELGLQEKMPITGSIQFVEAFLEQLVELRAQTQDDLRKDIDDARKRFEARLKTLRLIAKCAAASDDTRTPQEASTSGTNSLQVRKLKLSNFDGNVRLWREWYANFLTVIDRNDSIPTPREKLLQLLTYLTGEAKSAVAGRDPTDEEYPRTLATLRKRFGDPHRLAEVYYQDLKEIPPQTGYEASALRSTLDSVNIIVNKLTSCGSVMDHRTVINAVLAIFPIGMIRSIVKQNRPKDRDKDIELAVLLKEIDDNISVEEYIQARTAPLAPSSESVQVVALAGGSRKRNLPRTDEAPKRMMKVEKDVTCSFCDGGHYAKACRSYATAAARVARCEAIGRCTICAGKGHTTQDCRFQDRKCRVCDKTGHNAPLCPQYGQRKPQKPGTFLQTFMCKISIDQQKYLSVRGVLDSGSDISYILDSTISSLGELAGPKILLNVRALGSNINTTSTQVQATLLNYNNTSRVITLHTTPRLVENARLTPPASVAKQLLENLPNNLRYADPDLLTEYAGTVELLIGSDYYFRFITVERSKRIGKDAVLLPTFFGWIPAGKITPNSVRTLTKPKPSPVTSLLAVEQRDSIPQSAASEEQANKTTLEKTSKHPAPELEQFWDLEALGIRPSECGTVDESVMQHFRDTTRRENGRYVVSWPWKSKNPDLHTNFKLCKARLKHVLLKTPMHVLQKMDEIFTDQVDAGIIEQTEETTQRLIHYLPHKAVEHNGRVRVVNDASAKTKTGKSLNENVHAGPSMIKNLVGMLLNFRLRMVALSADIEKAFLQIGLDEADRDVCRFLWVKEFNKPLTHDNLIIFRFTRVPFGVNASPYLLNMTLQEHLSSYEQDWIIQLARKSLYVDNFLTSVDDEHQGSQVQGKLTRVLADGGFNLREWTTNSQTLQQAFPNDLKHLGDGKLSALGLNWDVSQDNLSYRFEPANIPQTGTLRLAMSNMSSVYDPLGLVAPCLLEFRLLIQDIWKAKLGWDTLLPPDLEVRLRKMVTLRNDIRNLTLPRYLWESIASPQDQYELHAFSDASGVAYGSATYLVRKGAHHNVEATLVMAKLRVAPIANKKSIPRLELMGALIATRQLIFVESLLNTPIQQRYLWTDATTVLQWLHSPQVQPLFIQNRLDEIRKTPHLTVRYVPSADNPADLITRGASASKLANSILWWHGPSWLTNERLWPDAPNAIQAVVLATISSPVVDMEILQGKPNEQGVNKALRFGTTGNYQFEDLYNDWNRYINVFTYVMRFKNPYAHLTLSPSALRRSAEIALLRLIQRKYFPEYISEIKCVTQLKLFRHTDGLIRCQSRFRENHFDLDMACPILLPRGQRITRVIIATIHRNNLHVGVSHTLALVRKRFWVPNCRALVSSVIHECLICRKYASGAYQLPPMAPLPSVRVTPVIPFLNTGLDYFGPLYIKDAHDNNCKAYCCIYTCLVTRALHLELVRNLTADEFLLSFIRFSSVRTKPNFVVSDNATNFKFVQPLLGRQVEILNSAVKHHFQQYSIDWYFIPAYSPWYGGVYERLISSVKKALRIALYPKLVQPVMIDYIQLETALKLVEDLVNSRPLTQVPAKELIETITPNSFLKLGRTTPGTPLVVNLHRIPSNKRTLVAGSIRAEEIINNYRTSFMSLYFTQLREIQAHEHRHKRGSTRRKPSKGDVVLIYDPSVPRSQWQTGIIDEVLDRQAWVTTVERRSNLNLPHNLLQRTRLLRPFNHFYPLELGLEPQPLTDSHLAPPTSTFMDVDPTPSSSSHMDIDVPCAPSAHMPMTTTEVLGSAPQVDP